MPEVQSSHEFLQAQLTRLMDFMLTEKNQDGDPILYGPAGEAVLHALRGCLAENARLAAQTEVKLRALR